MARITILEDTVALRIKIEKILNQYGLNNVEFLKNTRLAISNPDYVVKSADLLILDYDSYGEKTADIIVKLKEKEKRIPIIVMISSANISFLKTAARLGSVEILAKPFEDIKLIEKIFKFESVSDYKEFSLSKRDEEASNEEGFVLSWRDDFEIGVSEIDEEHRKMIDEFEKLYNFMKNGEGHHYYRELLDFLNNYVDTHFQNEEKLQKNISYKWFESHKKMHQQFENQLNEIIARSKEKEVTNEDLIKINLFVKNWLIRHILIEDKKIAEFIEGEM